MKKSKSIRPRDRLSELPESLIFQIFWLLPMRDVVRTTILSKHWKNLWTTAPCLNFKCYNSQTKFRNFVNRALLLWGGTEIQKFKIDLIGKYRPDESLFNDFDFWVHFVMGKNVQELYLHREDVCCEGYYLPKYLYSCSSLKVLSVKRCKLIIDGNVQWSRLKSLTIDCYGLSTDENLINQVLFGSPGLEDFFLTLCDSQIKFIIRSTTLKRFSIDMRSYDSDPLTDLELRIWTPNLETLEISGYPYSKCLLMDVCSLTHATLGFRDPEIYDDDSYDGNAILGETLSQIFPSIQHVEKVTLSDWCIKVLANMKNKYLLSSSANFKFLKLIKWYAKYEEIVGVIEIFPKLEILVIQDSTSAQHLFKFDANLPKSFLLQLRTVEITWADGNTSIFPFIKIVLKYASNLEKMVIRVTGKWPPTTFWASQKPTSKSLLLASQKLLSMPRSSPTAELFFCDY